MGFDGNLRPPDAVADPEELEDEFGPGPRFESRDGGAVDDDDDDDPLDNDADLDDDLSIAPVAFDDVDLDDDDQIPVGANVSMASGVAGID